MLNAFAISKLLLDDELPPVAPPADPDPFDNEDPQAALTRYMATPFKARGTPVRLYQEWKARLGNRVDRKLTKQNTGAFVGKQTWLVDRGGVIALRVYDTDVVTVTPENHVMVDMNGYQSRLSLRNVNWAAPGGWNLYGRRKRGLAFDDWTFYWFNSYSDKRLFLYTDGDTIDAEGTLTPQAPPDYSKVV